MWVKSQSKDFLGDIKIFEIYGDKNATIIGYAYGSSTTWYLGEYKTLEKAKSVFNDLQCRIARSESGVFQMPEDEK